MPKKKITTIEDKIEEPIEKPQEAPELKATVSAVQNPVSKEFVVDRTIDSGYPQAKKLPDIRGGICEFCGVLDPKVPSSEQYKLCPHWRGIKEIKCSYCPEGTDLKAVRTTRVFQIFEYPIDSGRLTVVCDDIRCRDKHLSRFNVGRTV